uniref:Etoposide-induced protein 2.4 n=1 Tax=viral metagenome TaxID=1070528 RepID=A0A6C0CB41_9ZZZZ
MANIMFKVCVCEFLMLVFTNIKWMLSDSHGGMLISILKIINGLFIFLSTIEFIAAIDIHGNNKKNSVVDVVSAIITMSIYQLSMMLLVNFINYVLFTTMSVFINFFILTIYHSFYVHNNLWQKKGIKINTRVDIYEHRWAYYGGFGILPTIIYMYSHNIYVASLYNIYLFALITTPFYLTEPVLLHYPKINMKVFAYVCEWIVYLASQMLPIKK